MPYRNPLAWNRNLRPGLFKSCSQDTPLPQFDYDPNLGLNLGSFAGFDWLADENNTDFTYSDLELDTMISELNEKGYGDNMGVAAIGSGADQLGFEMPGGRSINIRVWRSHSR